METPEIFISNPEKIETETRTIYDYKDSHVYFKGEDLGSFQEIVKTKAKCGIACKAMQEVRSCFADGYDDDELLMNIKKILKDAETAVKDL